VVAEYRILFIGVFGFIITLIDVIIVIHELFETPKELTITFVVLVKLANVAEVLAHLLIGISTCRYGEA